VVLPDYARLDARRRAVEVAELILAGGVGLVDGARQLVELTDAADLARDPDFAAIAAFASSTERFPVGIVRRRWATKALARLDSERAEIESAVRDDVRQACVNLIARLIAQSP
jgi:hypothetical protein